MRTLWWETKLVTEWEEEWELLRIKWDGGNCWGINDIMFANNIFLITPK
jgi:hypothetical protein